MLFGYHPPLISPSSLSGLEQAIRDGSSSRGGFSGELRHLRTPWGLADLMVGEKGVEVMRVVPLELEGGGGGGGEGRTVAPAHVRGL